MAGFADALRQSFWMTRYNHIIRTLTLILFGAALISVSVFAATERWPNVSPMKMVVNFPDASHAELSLDLRGPGDQNLYRLECHTWLYDKSRDFDYSGDFECRLIPLYMATRYSTLLTDDPDATRDWESRARFLVPELIGECASFRDYGRVRTFRLRHMQLWLEMADVKLRPSMVNASKGPFALTSFRFVVNVKPDPTAQSSIAEQTSARRPPRSCGAGS